MRSPGGHRAMRKNPWRKKDLSWSLKLTRIYIVYLSKLKKQKYHRWGQQQEQKLREDTGHDVSGKLWELED